MTGFCDGVLCSSAVYFLICLAYMFFWQDKMQARQERILRRRAWFQAARREE